LIDINADRLGIGLLDCAVAMRRDISSPQGIRSSTMSQPIDDLRNYRRWSQRGSAGYDEPMRFLERQGYVLTKDWEWRKPSPSHVITTEEADAIQFLTDEWDFGGVIEDSTGATG
jgi:hypothetical protein